MISIYNNRTEDKLTYLLIIIKKEKEKSTESH